MKLFILMIVATLFLAPAMRLLKAARRTRQMPEFWAALYFIGAGIGLPLRLYGSSVFPTDPELAHTVNILGHLFFASGAIAMAIFTWRVFHPDRSRAQIFAATVVYTIVLTTIHTLSTGNASAETSWSMLAANSARLAPTYWAFYESLNYWGSMRKRATLGIGDPVVANRFMLWAVWTFSVSMLPSAAVVLRLLEKIASAGGVNVVVGEFLPGVLFGMRLLFLGMAPIAVLALSLSFFPPARYLERVRARAASAGIA